MCPNNRAWHDGHFRAGGASSWQSSDLLGHSVKGFVTPQDVKAVGTMVLRHRVLTTYEAEAEGVDSEAVLRQVFDTVPVP